MGVFIRHADVLRLTTSKSKVKGKAEEKASPDPVPDETNLVTHLASSLMSLGDTELHSKTYERLVRSDYAAVDVKSGW